MLRSGVNGSARRFSDAPRQSGVYSRRFPHTALGMDSHPLFVLVDPSSQGLETLTHAFERDGCQVVGTADPLAAPEIVRSNHAQMAVIAVRSKKLLPSRVHVAPLSMDFRRPWP